MLSSRSCWFGLLTFILNVFVLISVFLLSDSSRFLRSTASVFALRFYCSLLFAICCDCCCVVFTVAGFYLPRRSFCFRLDGLRFWGLGFQ